MGKNFHAIECDDCPALIYYNAKQCPECGYTGDADYEWWDMATKDDGFILEAWAKAKTPTNLGITKENIQR